MAECVAGRWVELPPDIGYCHLIGEVAGVYVFLDEHGAVYVGSSINLGHRLSQYTIRPGYGGGWLTPWGQLRDLRLKIKPSARYGDWLMWEARLIRRLQPRCNRRGVSEENQVEYGEYYIHPEPRRSLPPTEWKALPIEELRALDHG